MLILLRSFGYPSKAPGPPSPRAPSARDMGGTSNMPSASTWRASPHVHGAVEPMRRAPSQPPPRLVTTPGRSVKRNREAMARAATEPMEVEHHQHAQSAIGQVKAQWWCRSPADTTGGSRGESGQCHGVQVILPALVHLTDHAHQLGGAAGIAPPRCPFKRKSSPGVAFDHHGGVHLWCRSALDPSLSCNPPTPSGRSS